MISTIVYIVSSHQIDSNKSQMIEAANTLFDPDIKVLKGFYTPSILGGPSISGMLEHKDAARIRKLNLENMEMGAIIKDDMKLIIYLSDDRFRLIHKK